MDNNPLLNATPGGTRPFHTHAEEFIRLLQAHAVTRVVEVRMVPQKSGVVLSISSVHEQIAWSGCSPCRVSKAADFAYGG